MILNSKLWARRGANEAREQRRNHIPAELTTEVNCKR